MDLLSAIRFLLGRTFLIGARVHATETAVAVGGDVQNSTITVGLDETAVGKEIEHAQLPLTENLAALAAQIGREKGIEAAPLRAILAKLGERNITDEMIPSRLSAMADDFIELRDSLKTEVGTELTSTKHQALEKLEAGNFSEAYATLEQGRLAVRKQRENAARAEAEILGDQARIDELQLTYLSAAAKYRDASLLVADDAAEAFKYLYKQATALQHQGEQFGDNEALETSIEVWRQAKALRPFEIAPEDHRKAHNNLASAIYARAFRDVTNERFYEVAAMNQEVLARDTRESAPVYWLAATANLAATLQVIGEREKRTDMLLLSVGLARDALNEIDRDSEPLNWAGIQNNVGNALKLIAEDQKTEEPLKEAIAAYREAASVLHADTSLNQRAMTLANLAGTLTELGRFRNSAEPLEQGIKVLNEVLALAPKEKSPIQWASTKLNLSSASNSLGIVTNDVGCFDYSIRMCTDALTIFTRESHPLQWANGRWGIGIALKLTAERTNELPAASEAVRILSEVNDILVASGDERVKPRIAGALSEAIALENKLAAREPYERG